eukprot:362856-Chlamydomonas_euryale.AAC.23
MQQRDPRASTSPHKVSNAIHTPHHGWHTGALQTRACSALHTCRHWNPCSSLPLSKTHAKLATTHCMQHHCKRTMFIKTERQHQARGTGGWNHARALLPRVVHLHVRDLHVRRVEPPPVLVARHDLADVGPGVCVARSGDLVSAAQPVDAVTWVKSTVGRGAWRACLEQGASTMRDGGTRCVAHARAARRDLAVRGRGMQCVAHARAARRDLAVQNGEASAERMAHCNPLGLAELRIEEGSTSGWGQHVSQQPGVSTEGQPMGDRPW